MDGTWLAKVPVTFYDLTGDILGRIQGGGGGGGDFEGWSPPPPPPLQIRELQAILDFHQSWSFKLATLGNNISIYNSLGRKLLLLYIAKNVRPLYLRTISPLSFKILDLPLTFVKYAWSVAGISAYHVLHVHTTWHFTFVRYRFWKKKER